MHLRFRSEGVAHWPVLMAVVSSLQHHTHFGSLLSFDAFARIDPAWFDGTA